jgi:hypothetical protein
MDTNRELNHIRKSIEELHTELILMKGEIRKLRLVKRGVQQSKSSKAKYQFKGQPNLGGLERALKVFDSLNELKVSGVKKPQWKVARGYKYRDIKRKARSGICIP